MRERLSVYGGPVPASEPLTAAIDRLYAAFSGVRRPSVIEYCTCCFSADEEQALLAPVALRQLSIDVLRPYAFDVLLTVGDAADACIGRLGSGLAVFVLPGEPGESRSEIGHVRDPTSRPRSPRCRGRRQLPLRGSISD